MLFHFVFVFCKYMKMVINFFLGLGVVVNIDC